MLIEKKCQEKGWTILELTVEPDHVHLFVRAWPIYLSRRDYQGV